MQDDILEIGVAFVAVGGPTVCPQVHLDIAGAGWIVTKLHHGVVEIRPGLAVAKTRMKNFYPASVQCPELVAAQALMLPDGLEQALRRRVIALMQGGAGELAQPPFGIGDLRRHGKCFARRVCNVKRPGIDWSSACKRFEHIGAGIVGKLWNRE